jgi:PAS domain S-box-containing protein
MNIRKIMYDKIVILVIFYVIFVVCSFVGIFSLDNFIHKRIQYINSIYYNETSKIQLNDHLKQKIALIQNTMLAYMKSENFNDMDRYEKQLSETLDSIVSILYVLEYGGIYSEDIKVNYKGLDNVEQKVTYTKYFTDKYNIQVMDLRAKLIDVRNLMDDLRSLVIDSIISTKSSDISMTKDVSARSFILVKTIDAFFERMDESSNRLYVESSESGSFIKQYLSDTIHKFRALKLKVNLILGVIMLLSGIVITNRIYKTVKQRSIYSRELNALNDSLEDTVRKRTAELESEVAIRRRREIDSTTEAKFLMDVIESLAHPFYVIDAENYEIIHANSFAYSVLGGSGFTCYELTHHSNHPCDGLEHPCPLKQVIDTGLPISVEHIHTNKNGEKRYVEVHGYPLKDENGKVTQMIEYSLDITDKKDAEVALINLNAMLEEKVTERTRKLETEVRNREIAEKKVKQREMYFRQLISSISDIVIILDATQGIKFISPSVETICGFRADQLIGKSFEDILHPRDKSIFKVWFENVLKSKEEKKTAEFRLQKRSGQFLNGEAIANNMTDDEVIGGVIINIRDVSIRKHAEEEMRKLALVMEQNPNSILITDIDGNVEYVNPAFENTTGYTMQEMMGKNPNILKTDETPKETFEELWATVTKGKVWQGEFVNKKKNGQHYIEHAIIAPIMNEKGEIVSYLGMKENITELKKAREKAEESNRAKSMFLANMSHEIRTPLNGLMGFLDLLKETHLDTEQFDYVNTIKFSADSLLRILNDILDLSKIESGMMELEKAEIDLGFNILSTAKAFYAKANNKGVSLYSYIDPQIPQVLLGDSLRINQVLSNLLNNAVKFTPEGGSIKISVDLLKETAHGADISISVSDTGEGIDADKIETIFESFAQADSSVTRKYGGTGLGLTITKNLINMMGSEIYVESEKGKGSRFYFDLSLSKPHSTMSQKKTVPENKVYLCGGGDKEFNHLLEKYLVSMEADYEFIDAPDTADADSGIFIFNESSYDKAKASALIDKGCRVIYVMNYGGGDAGDERVQTIVRPFDGLAFHEVLSGLPAQQRFLKPVGHKSVHLLTGRVLLAEDNKVNIKLMDTMLRRMGLDVDIAENGQDAAELCTTKKYDLVLMDINMPEMDGVTAAAKIREHEKNVYKDRVPIIALTAHSMNEINKRFVDNDFDAYLSKPVQMNELEDMLKMYITKQEVIDVSLEAFDLGKLTQEIGLPYEVLKGLVLNYCKNFADDAEKLKSFAVAGEYEKLKSLIHSHKGAASNLRINNLLPAFIEIENKSRLKETNGIIEDIDMLSVKVQKIIEMIDTENI